MCHTLNTKGGIFLSLCVMALQEQIISCPSGPVLHRYLCHYKPRAVGSDKLSESLLRFKQGYSLDLQAWTECAQTVLTSVLDRTTTLVRALSHQEILITNPPYTPLDLLGSKLAHQCSGKYTPQCLLKKRTTKPLKLFSRAERQNELNQVYQVNPELISTSSNTIMILDDILTSGTTIRAIAEAFFQVAPEKVISAFTLAYTENSASLNDKLILRSFTYQWDQHTGWAPAEESTNYYGALSTLKQKIFNDAF